MFSSQKWHLSFEQCKCGLQSYDQPGCPRGWCQA
jgi:hypothetical protein